jgi:hypothetical protein
VTEPAVPLLRADESAMSLSAAFRQAAIDAPRDLPAGWFWDYAFEQGEGGTLRVVIAIKHAHLGVLWQHPYNGRGHRLVLGGGGTW